MALKPTSMDELSESSATKKSAEPSESTSLTVTQARGVTFPLGFKAAATRAGLKSKNLDLMLLVADGPAACAGVFTKNLVAAASVGYSKEIAMIGSARAIFCNAGNANACTGPQGEADNRACAVLTAQALGLQPNQVFVASTGVIGRPMPMAKVASAVPAAAIALQEGEDADANIAQAIMTTDLRPKQIAVEILSDHWIGPLRIGAVAKGSGMIAPNMATTLGFITTDAQIASPALQRALVSVMNRTFNRVTVDGDTSTNDMVLAMASGAGPANIATDEAFQDFEAGLHHVCAYLAKEIAGDGEGATKLVTVKVKGARTDAEADKVARSIAESPLVKTALFGCDPNWGRIMAAAGRSGVIFDPARASAFIGPVQVYRGGMGADFDADAAHAYLNRKEVDIVVDLAVGPAEAFIWTCDFSYDYVRINAEYHT